MSNLAPALTLILFVLNGLFSVAGFFAVLWIRGLQQQLDESRTGADALERDLRQFKDLVLADYARRSDVNGTRAEVLTLLRDIDAKVSKLADKLDAKEDRR